jgi:hypothetical protein
VGTRDKATGLLAIHHQLVELRIHENELRSELHMIVEKRGALEQILKSAPAPHARPRPPARSVKAAKAAKRAVRIVKARTSAKKPGRKARPGAPNAVLGLLRERQGTSLTTKEIRTQLSDLPPASIHNALSVLKKRGSAKSAGPGMWAAASA